MQTGSTRTFSTPTFKNFFVAKILLHSSYMKLLKAQHIHYPHLYKEYSVKQLENFYNYHTKRMTTSQSYRLRCLMDHMDIHGLYYPIILSENGYRVYVGHQRVWYATQRGYTHISCYHCSTQADVDMVMSSTFDETYWKNSFRKKSLENNSNE